MTDQSNTQDSEPTLDQKLAAIVRDVTAGTILERHAVARIKLAYLMATPPEPVAQPEALPVQGEPVGYVVWWGLGRMRPSKTLHTHRVDADNEATRIKSNTEVRPVFADLRSASIPAGDDTVRLDALQKRAGVLNQWIVAVNKHSFTVNMGRGSHATRATLREAIDALLTKPAQGCEP